METTTLFLSGGAYCIDCGWVRCRTLVTGTAGVVWEMEGAALSKDTFITQPTSLCFSEEVSGTNPGPFDELSTGNQDSGNS